MKRTLQALAGISQKRSPKTVAVVTMLGSFCPITLAHSQAFDEARRLLLDPDLRPNELEDFDHVLGFISANPDHYVSRKFSDGVVPISYDDRLNLAKMAIQDKSDWMGVEEEEGQTALLLKHKYRTLKFVHFTMNGADDVIKSRKWKWANSENRFITMGRPGETARLLERMKHAKAEFGPNFVLGPELPDLSSTAAREALLNRDLESLNRMLHPEVTEWCLLHGPWREDEQYIAKQEELSQTVF